jgi:predicted RNA-binding protein with EMAP domain
MTPQENTILETVLSELLAIKRGMPNGELKQMAEIVKDMKEDISELKYTLLNPEDGVIVKVNKNTEFRREREARIPEIEKQSKDLEEIKNWKEGVTKALWILFTAIAAIIARLFFISTIGTNI